MIVYRSLTLSTLYTVKTSTPQGLEHHKASTKKPVSTRTSMSVTRFRGGEAPSLVCGIAHSESQKPHPRPYNCIAISIALWS